MPVLQLLTSPSAAGSVAHAREIGLLKRRDSPPFFRLGNLQLQVLLWCGFPSHAVRIA